MLEFWLDPNSSYYQENKIKDLKKMVLFCALEFRSALATKALVDMGFKNVANASGGFDALKNVGLKVVPKEKNNLFTCFFQSKFNPILPPKNFVVSYESRSSKYAFS